MRKDLIKVLLECPKVCGDGGRSIPIKRYAKVQKLHKEDHFLESDSHEGMNRPYGKRHKEFNVNLKPVLRFIEGQIGRLWNDVWSEICKAIPYNKGCGAYVRDCITTNVELNVYMENGVAYYKAINSIPFLEVDGLYVNPDTGIICKQNIRKNRSRLSKKQDKFFDPKNKMIQYHNINGVWYEIKLGKYIIKSEKQNGRSTFKFVDELTGHVVQDALREPLNANQNYGCLYAKSKRQIGKRELKKLRSIIDNLESK